ncbi:hypothetical protein [Nocardia sp. alder85J]|uniref:hypothetical protein n=1 Tax=Nocardia sp. alder85J TaxID=2862949 RepID=UPI001CD74D9C|nr:hypothetical protein [Nocardia sp. alder85J]MCX4094586.1 hypothetical protein [Nocardia sp. alder85J]
MAIKGVESGREVVLAGKLFAPVERWGWEYLSPPPPVPCPVPAPVWIEPGIPDREKLANLYYASKYAWQYLVAGAAFVLPITAGAAAVSLYAAPVVLLGGMAASFGIYGLKRGRYTSAVRELDAFRDNAIAQFQQRQQEWKSMVAAHDQRERQRVAATPVWFPVRPETQPRRIEVFGGTPEGWRGLVATLGAGQLASGGHVLVVDFTEEHVATDLAGLAASQRCPVHIVDLPGTSRRFNSVHPAGTRIVSVDDLLVGLSADEVADLVSEAVHSARSGESEAKLGKYSGSVDLRNLDARLVRMVCERLDGSATFARIEAGLLVLSRLYRRGGDAVLSDAELARLNAIADDVGTTERVTGELQTLTELAGSLARNIGQSARRGYLGERLMLWPNAGISVLATASPRNRQKDLLDRIVFQSVLHELRERNFADRNATRDLRSVGADTLIVVGADHMGLEGLEDLSTHTRRAGLRLVLIIEHLREELRPLLGGADSAAIFMQLKNVTEATAAADYIGKAHKFVVSTYGQNASYTKTDGQGTNESFGQNSGWGTGKNFSEAAAQGVSQTEARVHEYRVEPTAIQELPSTRFIMIEHGHEWFDPLGNKAYGQGMVVADCNPAIVLEDRVTDTPLSPRTMFQLHSPDR